MNRTSLAFSIALLAISAPAGAASQEHHHDMAQHQTAARPAATQQGAGVLKAVNEKSAKVQIAHEPIAALEWPAMTMWFRLEAQLPKDLKPGDKVRFEMQQGDDKQWRIVKIERK